MIARGDQLGAQLSKIAELIYICRENGQQLVFWKELRHFRRGYQFLETFEIDDVEYIERCGKVVRKIVDFYNKRAKALSWKEQMHRIYHNKIYRFLDRVIYELVRWSYRDFHNCRVGKNDVYTNPALLKLGSTGNFDIHTGFGTYQDWGKYADDICTSIHFRYSIREAGDRIFAELQSPKKKVAVHFRRTDYLILSSLCLGDAYYEKALSYFDPEEYQFLVFSDDIESCKKMELFRGKDVVFMQQNPGAVDMYLMSLCDGNIIANSTFSFWGAYLGYNNRKKVICPHDFIGENAIDSLYINGNYYPETWIAI